MTYDQVLIKPQPLNDGTFFISGFKHAITVIIACSISCPTSNFVIDNVPDIQDVDYLCRILNELGCYATFQKNRLILQTAGLHHAVVPRQWSQAIHGAIYLLPVLLGRMGYVDLGPCGGCQLGPSTALGNRPLQHMLSVLEKFGARFNLTEERLQGICEKYVGCEIDIMEFSTSSTHLTGPNVSGATKTALLAASLAEGATTIHHPYPKCDVTELLSILTKCGYQIDIMPEKLTVTPPQYEKPNLVQHHLIADISQIITAICLAVMHDIKLRVFPLNAEAIQVALKPELAHLSNMGIVLHWQRDSLLIPANQTVTAREILVLSTTIYSDHQPFFALMLTRADKPSLIKEAVWHARFSYAIQLQKLGLDLRVERNTVTIYPSKIITPHEILYAHDLRSAAVLLLAALQAPAPINLSGISHLGRGYDTLFSNLQNLGAKLQWVGKANAQG